MILTSNYFKPVLKSKKSTITERSNSMQNFVVTIDISKPIKIIKLIGECVYIATIGSREYNGKY